MAEEIKIPAHQWTNGGSRVYVLRFSDGQIAWVNHSSLGAASATGESGAASATGWSSAAVCTGLSGKPNVWYRLNEAGEFEEAL